MDYLWLGSSLVPQWHSGALAPYDQEGLWQHCILASYHTASGGSGAWDVITCILVPCGRYLGFWWYLCSGDCVFWCLDTFGTLWILELILWRSPVMLISDSVEIHCISTGVCVCYLRWTMSTHTSYYYQWLAILDIYHLYLPTFIYMTAGFVRALGGDSWSVYPLPSRHCHDSECGFTLGLLP